MIYSPKVQTWASRGGTTPVSRIRSPVFQIPDESRGKNRGFLTSTGYQSRERSWFEDIWVRRLTPSLSSRYALPGTA